MTFRIEHFHVVEGDALALFNAGWNEIIERGITIQFAPPAVHPWMEAWVAYDGERPVGVDVVVPRFQTRTAEQAMAYVVPDMRGKDVWAALAAVFEPALAARGFEKLVYAVTPERLGAAMSIGATIKQHLVERPIRGGT